MAKKQAQKELEYRDVWVEKCPWKSRRHYHWWKIIIWWQYDSLTLTVSERVSNNDTLPKFQTGTANVVCLYGIVWHWFTATMRQLASQMTAAIEFLKYFTHDIRLYTSTSVPWDLAATDTTFCSHCSWSKFPQWSQQLDLVLHIEYWH